MRVVARFITAFVLLVTSAVLFGPPAQAVTAFVDSFDTRNTTRWSWGAGTSVSSGRLRLADTLGGSTVATRTQYDLQSFQFEVATRPSGAVLSAYAIDGNHYIEWYLDGSTLWGYVDDAEVFRATWSATSHRWLRFAVDGRRVVFFTSTNGTLWTSRGTTSLNWDATSVTMGLSANRWSGKATSGGVGLDNVTLTTTDKPTNTSASTEAAGRYGWGSPDAGSEFGDPSILQQDTWDVFWGPGYQGKGWQSGEAVQVKDGLLTITGNEQGDTGAVGYFGAMRRYGRWESRIRIPQGDGSYHPVALLWPTSGVWPDDGEIDYFESTGSAAKSSFSLHHGSGNPHVTEIGIDRQWHNYAVEWTSTTITAYLDGVPYYSTTEISAFPPGPMWHSFQLDWMGYAGSVDTVMEVDWLRFYDAP